MACYDAADCAALTSWLSAAPPANNTTARSANHCCNHVSMRVGTCPQCLRITAQVTVCVIVRETTSVIPPAYSSITRDIRKSRSGYVYAPNASSATQCSAPTPHLALAVLQRAARRLGLRRRRRLHRRQVGLSFPHHIAHARQLALQGLGCSKGGRQVGFALPERQQRG